MIDDDLLHIQNGSGLSVCDHSECPMLSINAEDYTTRKKSYMIIFCEATFCCMLLL